MAFVIRPEQMLAFEAHAKKQFYAEAMRLLRKRQPNECAKMTEESLFKYVEEGAAQAEQMGLKTDQSTLQFLEIGLLPEEFRQRPLIREVITRVLANDALALEPRVAFLHDQLVRRAALENGATVQTG